MFHLQADIFNVNETNFEKTALEIFRFQAVHCFVYQDYLNALNIHPTKVESIAQIPFLPVEFFKNKEVICQKHKPQIVFTSSGTTGANTSRHAVCFTDIYEASFLKSFELFYGSVQQYTILALLPSYLERTGSSLVYMADKLIKLSENPNSGFYLHNTHDLYLKLQELEKNNQKTLLLGVTYALLDFAEKYNLQLKNTIVMETGGMKGKRAELIRNQLHDILCNGFRTETIHSEYGMTELLSQAYSKGNGLFATPPWMKILVRDMYDPFAYMPQGKSGGINIIDLANIYSCSFIETKDIGVLHTNGMFEILGRFDNSDIRGCNLMVSA